MITVFGYVAAKAFDSFMAARGEDFKAKLLREAEDHRASLERTNQEHSVRFASLHAERAIVIKTLYAHLSDLFGALDAHATYLIVGIVGDNGERIGAASRQLLQYFLPHRIYIDEALCIKIEALVSATVTTRQLISELQQAEQAPAGEIVEADRVSTIVRAITSNRSDVKVLLKELENEFRQILGHG